MAEHRVEMHNVLSDVTARDVVFDVYADEAKFGMFTVSRGGVGWFPFNSPQERRLTWEQFDRIVRAARG